MGDNGFYKIIAKSEPFSIKISALYLIRTFTSATATMFFPIVEIPKICGIVPNGHLPNMAWMIQIMPS